MTGAFYKPGEESVALWLTGNTPDEVEFVRKVRDLCVEEINRKIMIGEWDVKELIEQGGALTEFANDRMQALEDAEDAAILQEGEDE